MASDPNLVWPSTRSMVPERSREAFGRSNRRSPPNRAAGCHSAVPVEKARATANPADSCAVHRAAGIVAMAQMKKLSERPTEASIESNALLLDTQSAADGYPYVR